MWGKTYNLFQGAPSRYWTFHTWEQHNSDNSSDNLFMINNTKLIPFQYKIVTENSQFNHVINIKQI